MRITSCEIAVHRSERMIHVMTRYADGTADGGTWNTCANRIKEALLQGVKPKIIFREEGES